MKRITASDDAARKIRMAAAVKSGTTLRDAAKRFQVSWQAVSEACRELGVVPKKGRKQFSWEALSAAAPLAKTLRKKGRKP